MIDKDEKLTYAEAADTIGVSVLTIKRAVAKGELAAIRYNSRVVRIRKDELERYEVNRTTPKSN